MRFDAWRCDSDDSDHETLEMRLGQWDSGVETLKMRLRRWDSADSDHETVATKSYIRPHWGKCFATSTVCWFSRMFPFEKQVALKKSGNTLLRSQSLPEYRSPSAAILNVAILSAVLSAAPSVVLSAAQFECPDTIGRICPSWTTSSLFAVQTVGHSEHFGANIVELGLWSEHCGPNTVKQTLWQSKFACIRHCRWLLPMQSCHDAKQLKRAILLMARAACALPLSVCASLGPGGYSTQ